MLKDIGLSRADAYIECRQLIEDGKAKETQETLKRAFGDNNPSPEIKDLRKKADALIEADRLMHTHDRYAEPLKLLGAVSGAFADDTRNKAALGYIAEAVANEIYRNACTNGYDTARNDYENYRKRFPNMLSWSWVETQLNMGGIWDIRVVQGKRNYQDVSAYWTYFNAINKYCEGKPEALYRFGCFHYVIARKCYVATCEGAGEWLEALKQDPSLKDRHEELMECYAISMGGDRANLFKDLKTDVAYIIGSFTYDLQAMRDLVKDYFYADLVDTLVSYTANTEKEFGTERMNALAILAEKGDARLIEDRFALFRDEFDTFVRDPDRLSRYHSNALFQAEMSYDDYKEYRRLIDGTIAAVRDGTKYSGYTRVPGILQNMLEDLRNAQPQHTAQYDG